MPKELLSPFLVLVRSCLPGFIFLFWLLFSLGYYYQVNLVIKLQDLISVVVLLGCTLLLWPVLRFISFRERKAWILIWISCFFHIIAEALWGYHVWIYAEDPESPSISDVFYLIDSLLLILGMFIYTYSIARSKMEFMSIDFIITGVVLAGLIYYFQVSPLWEHDYSFNAVMVKIFYLLCDLLILYCLLYLFFAVHDAVFNTRDLFLGLALLFLALGDELDLADSGYDLGIEWLIEPLWSVPYLFFLLSALQPDPKRNIRIDFADDLSFLQKTLDLVRICLPFLGTLLILGLMVIKYQLNDPLFWWVIALVSLLSFRQILVILFNRQLLRTLSKTYAQLNHQNLQLQSLNQQISQDAKTDYLTGLYNRRFLDALFNEVMEPSAHCESVSVLIIDVDRFKQVNDTFGHQCGDFTLSRIAKLLQQRLEQNSFACRYGGDEFMVLLENKTAAQTEEIAAGLIEQVREDETLRSYMITLSIGYVVARRGDKHFNSAALLRMADTALYQAKHNGRDQYRAYVAAEGRST